MAYVYPNLGYQGESGGGGYHLWIGGLREYYAKYGTTGVIAMLRDKRDGAYLYREEGPACVTPKGCGPENTRLAQSDLRVCDIAAIHLSPYFGFEENIGIDDDDAARDVIVNNVIQRLETQPMECAVKILRLEETILR
jgi:hypothetical protein